MRSGGDALSETGRGRVPRRRLKNDHTTVGSTVVCFTDRRVRSARLGRLVRSALHLDLTAKDGAPVFMLRHRHPALDADADTLLRWLVPA
jgi:hypothetical protein